MHEIHGSKSIFNTKIKRKENDDDMTMSVFITTIKCVNLHILLSHGEHPASNLGHADPLCNVCGTLVKAPKIPFEKKVLEKILYLN